MRRRHKAGFALASAVLHACGHQPVTVQTVGTTSTSSPSTTEATTTTEAPATTTAPTTSAPAVTAPPSPPSTAGAEPTPPTTVRRTTTTAATSDEPAPAGQSARVSWYGDESGSHTANGDRYDPNGLTFAHLSMPFGTSVRFCGPLGCVVAVCTDRGPAAWTGKTFDLSRGAFARVAPLSAGVATLTWAVVG